MIWALLAFGFVLGSIPFGYLIARSQGVDIRSVGSGNIGTTNVLRTLGKGPAAVVFVLDVAKGLIPAILARQLVGSQEAAFACGASAIVGHSFSPFLGFRGGKGIATGLGMLLGASPLVAVSAFGAFFVTMAITLIVSVASVVAGFSVVCFGLLYRESNVLLGAYVVLGLYILARHRANLSRLQQGTEPRFGQKPGEPPPPGSKMRVTFGILAIAMGAIVAVSTVLK